MEVLWENRCIISQTQYQKISALSWTMGKKLLFFFDVFLFALLAAVLFCVPLPGGRAVGGAAAAIAVLLVAGGAVLPRWVSKRAYQKLCCGAPALEMETVFTEDWGWNRYTQGEERLAFQYAQIRRCREMEGLFLLELDSGIIIPLDASGFQNGTGDGWKKWLQERQPHIRWLWTPL